MDHNDMLSAIAFIRPNAKFVLRGEDVEWADDTQTEPTKKEIEAGLTAYKTATKAEAKAKETAKAAILDRLGLTADELKTILG
jgi:hypothetical protein